MKLSHPSRFVAACIALVSMLFMQLALASYACPELGTGQVSISAEMADHAPCHDMDAARPSLCHAHGQAGHQSLDKPELPHVQPFAATGRALPSNSVDASHRSAAAPPQAALLTRATAPPLAIRHCRFRI